MADEEQVDKSTHSDNQYSLDTAKHKEIDDLLQGYSDAVTTKLRCAIGLSHKMNTQAHDPIRTPPYRLVLGWRDKSSHFLSSCSATPDNAVQIVGYI